MEYREFFEQDKPMVIHITVSAFSVRLEDVTFYGPVNLPPERGVPEEPVTRLTYPLNQGETSIADFESNIIQDHQK